MSDFYTEFLATVTHEFRTPLSALNASIELLLDEVDHLKPAERDELLNSIHLSVTSLQLLVDNLLETSTIKAGRFVIHRHATPFNQILAAAIRVMQPLLDRRRQALILTEPLALPTLLLDSTRMTQVLINLLANASKYSPIDSTIEIIVTAGVDFLRVAIADHGTGIPTDQRDYLFDRFARLDLPVHGVGLGLSVVKAIIEGHGGKVGLADDLSGGTRVWFTLPLGTPKL